MDSFLSLGCDSMQVSLTIKSLSRQPSLFGLRSNPTVKNLTTCFLLQVCKVLVAPANVFVYVAAGQDVHPLQQARPVTKLWEGASPQGGLYNHPLRGAHVGDKMMGMYS